MMKEQENQRIFGSRNERHFSESETVELKRSTSELKEGVISIVAILNKHQKGELWFGIKNDGTAVGQTVTESTIREVSKTISDYIEPKIFPKIEEVRLEGKSCVRVEFVGGNNPYYAYGRAYMRVGDEDRQISAKELERLILNKNRDKLRWDKETCAKAKIKDIDEEKVKKFVEVAGVKYVSIKSSLEKLSLVKEGKLLNVAVLFFAKHPEDFFPNAKLRCAVFGETTATTIDMQDFVGDIFTLIEKAEKYILENIHIGMRLDGLRRVDVPEIDKGAFREAIINAFCHRDYYEYDSVNIAIFKDRLEIRSPGELYGGLTIEKMKKEEVSKRRNELIADMFHRVHFVEKWGRGIKLILSKEPTVDFKVIAGIFITVFKRKGVENGVNEGVNEGVNLLIELIRKNPGKRVPQLATTLGIPAKTIERWIKQFKEEGKIEFKGSPKKGGYCLK